MLPASVFERLSPPLAERLRACGVGGVEDRLRDEVTRASTKARACGATDEQLALAIGVIAALAANSPRAGATGLPR
ncbi:MAG TPA: hypothetical protein VIM73_01675 [Polyangiaceae bacterium]